MEEALARKAELGEAARIIAGGTDLLIEMDRGSRSVPDGSPLALIDLTRVPGLAEIEERGGHFHLGPLVTHNQCVTHGGLTARAFPLVRACWEVGSPPLRNRATVVGNLITASPANDTIVPLLALAAQVTVASAARGSRALLLADFLTGFRTVDLAPDEVVTGLRFPAMSPQQRGGFIKLGLRRAQAISVVSVAAILGLDGDRVNHARIALGAVAPTIVRAEEAEAALLGQPLTPEVIGEAARLALHAAHPIDDVRSSAAYRREMVHSLTRRLLTQIREGREREGWSDRPVTLRGRTDGKWPVPPIPNTQYPIPTTTLVNGQPITLPGQMTLLDSLRAAGFVGVKEGCAEGECGACTVFLDGMAALACLIPAERAAGSEVITVEGLAQADQLHPVQAAFVQSGGVQCGYCTPGFLMSAAKLLEERPHPSRGEAQEAFTGNLCRCTGYRKILDAVVRAGEAIPADDSGG
jgi:carbon-monoxide dehydrogenase medium subunit